MRGTRHLDIKLTVSVRVALICVVCALVSAEISAGEPRSILKHAGQVFFTPNGRQIVTVGLDSARLWDAASGKQITEYRHGLRNPQSELSADGRLLGLWQSESGQNLSPSQRAVIWDLTTSRPIRVFEHDGIDGVEFVGPTLFFTQSGGFITRFELKVWDLSTGRLRAHITSQGIDPIGGGDKHGTLLIRDTATDKDTLSIQHSCRVGPYGSFQLVSPDGRTIVVPEAPAQATLAIDSLLLFELASGKQRHTIRSPDTTGVKFAADGRKMLTISPTTFRLWDVETGNLVVSFNVRQIAPSNRAFVNVFQGSDVLPAFRESDVVSPGGEWMLAPDEKAGQPSIWNLASGRQLALIDHANIDGWFWAAGGKRVVTYSSAGELPGLAQIWDTSSGELLATLKHHLERSDLRLWVAGRGGVGLSGDQRILGIAGEVPSGEIAFWDVRSSKVINVIKTGRPVTDMSLTSDGKTLAVCGGHVDVSLFDIGTRTMQRSLSVNPARRIIALAFSPNDRLLAVVGSYKSWTGAHVQLWDTHTWQDSGSFNEPSGKAVKCLAFSPDSCSLALGLGSTVVFWDVATHRTTRRLAGHKGDVKAVCFFPDGKRMAAISSYDNGSGEIKFWDQSTGSPVMTTAISDPSAVVVTRDAKALAVAVRGRGIDKIDGNTGKRSATLFESSQTHLIAGDAMFGTDFNDRNWTSTMDVSHDGKWFVSGGHLQGYDDKKGQVVLWDIKSHRAKSLLERDTGLVRSVLFSPDDKTIIAGGAARRSTSVTLFDLLAKQRVTISTSGSTGVHLSPDGAFALTGVHSGHAHFDDGIIVWDAAAGNRLAILPGDFRIAQFSPDVRFLALPQIGRVEVWDVAAIKTAGDLYSKRILEQTQSLLRAKEQALDEERAEIQLKAATYYLRFTRTKTSAVKALQQIIEEYPQTRAATKARTLLDEQKRM